MLKKMIIKNNILKRKLDVGQTSESGGDLETQKNKKCNQTLYFCVLGYMNYFIKIICVVYVSDILVNIKCE
jgi:hypothetical protein